MGANVLNLIQHEGNVVIIGGDRVHREQRSPI